MSRFKRTPSTFTSMSDLFANEEISNREEINIECFDKAIDNWEISKVQANQKIIFFKIEHKKAKKR